MEPVVVRCFPRAGLLGNPSDLYGGRGIGFTFSDFEAVVRLERGIPDPGELELFGAARDVLADRGAEEAEDRTLRFSFESTIPRQAGLSGSSALVIGALRALAEVLGVELEAGEFADLALRAENDVLGVTAGPMDRVIQAYGGVLSMDFESGGVEPVASELMPALRMLIDPEPGEDSGVVHTPVRERWEEGEPEVRLTMASFRPLVERGLAALVDRDLERLCDCVDENFELRRRVFPIGERDLRMVELGRAHGCAAKFCGSGGAVLLVPRSGVDLASLGGLGADEGFRFLEPSLCDADGQALERRS